MAPWIKGYRVPISAAAGLSTATVAYLAHKGLHGLLGSGPETLDERPGKGALHGERDDLVLAEMALQGMEGPGMHLACEGTAAFFRVLCPVQRVLERLDLLERARVSLVEKATGNLQAQADQIGRIQAEIGKPLPLTVIHGDQICQPMEAFENDPGGPCGQECRCRLGGGDASPDEDVERR